jgi:hypothetical protein
VRAAGLIGSDQRSAARVHASWLVSIRVAKRSEAALSIRLVCAAASLMTPLAVAIRAWTRAMQARFGGLG